jgi:hypothetical protein
MLRQDGTVQAISPEGPSNAERAFPGVPERWGATAAEAEAPYPCDELAEAPHIALTRAIDVDAPVTVIFRWLCQLRTAPYSYDWVDNLGRRSPRELTPGLDKLEPGQRFTVATITSFATDQHITGRATPAAERLFGLISLTYAVASRGPYRSRLISRLNVHQPSRLWEKARYRFLAWGDLIMMRKQLRTLKGLAEQQVTDSGTIAR